MASIRVIDLGTYNILKLPLSSEGPKKEAEKIVTVKMYIGERQELIDNQKRFESVFDKWISKKGNNYRLVSHLDKRGLVLTLVKRAKEKKNP